MKKIIIFTAIFMNSIFEIYSQEQPLVLLNINIDDEIWLDGEIILFNGWPPHVRMLVLENYIIGIDESNLPKIIVENIMTKSIKGKFKLKFIDRYNIPYYETQLLIFIITEYKNIELILK
ncbi:hypothetical protein PilKf_01003 [Pillotina sp. SPG140]|jgi:hypothetical protein